jgi:hypothetical protein
MFQVLDVCTPALSAKLRLHLPGKPIDILALILNMDPDSAAFFSKHLGTNMERTQARYHDV